MDGLSPQMEAELRQFPDFIVIDFDNSTAYLRRVQNGKTDVVEIRILYGSLGAYLVKYIVEKHGYRSKLFSGITAPKRIKTYLNE